MCKTIYLPYLITDRDVNTVPLDSKCSKLLSVKDRTAIRTGVRTQPIKLLRKLRIKKKFKQISLC
jgi:hypothetical protein